LKGVPEAVERYDAYQGIFAAHYPIRNVSGPNGPREPQPRRAKVFC